MKGHQAFRIAIALLVPVAYGCGDDDEDNTPTPATNFSADLSGANEVPAVTTPATGTATLTVNGDVIEYSIDVSELQNALVAHIHVAPPGEPGPIRMNLCGTGDPQPACTSGTGVLAAGSNGTTVDRKSVV